MFLFRDIPQVFSNDDVRGTSLCMFQNHPRSYQNWQNLVLAIFKNVQTLLSFDIRKAQCPARIKRNILIKNNIINIYWEKLQRHISRSFYQIFTYTSYHNHSLIVYKELSFQDIFKRRGRVEKVAHFILALMRGNRNEW